MSPHGKHMVRVVQLSPLLIQALPNTRDPLGCCECAHVSLLHQEIHLVLKNVMAWSLCLCGMADTSMRWLRFMVERKQGERLLLLAETLGQRVGDAVGKVGSTGVCVTH